MNRVVLGVVFAVGIGLSTAHAIDCYTEIDPIYYETDVRSLIRAVTPADVVRIRRDLISYVWKAPTLPEGLPDVETNVENPYPELDGDPSWSRVDQLTVTLDGFVSRMFLFVPAHPKHRLMIFHQGHALSLENYGGASTVQYFLQQHFPVLIINMPLYITNTGPPGPPTIVNHDDMFRLLDSPTLSPFKYFLEPVVRAVNYARQNGLPRVDMIGISGGGWTTTVAAALDPRITTSFPVAGSLPLYLRRTDTPCSGNDIGDSEQFFAGFYSMVDYLDLYILGTYGRGRGQLQVLNQFDACCFFGLRFLTYESILKDVIRPLRFGRYDIFLDTSHMEHTISPHALESGVTPFLIRRHL